MVSEHSVTPFGRTDPRSVEPCTTSIANDHSGYQADSFMLTRGAMPRNPKVLDDPQMAVAATNRLPDYRRPYEDTTPVSFIEPLDVS